MRPEIPCLVDPSYECPENCPIRAKTYEQIMIQANSQGCSFEEIVKEMKSMKGEEKAQYMQRAAQTLEKGPQTCALLDSGKIQIPSK